jgi:hypothetical protein
MLVRIEVDPAAGAVALTTLEVGLVDSTFHRDTDPV